MSTNARAIFPGKGFWIPYSWFYIPVFQNTMFTTHLDCKFDMFIHVAIPALSCAIVRHVSLRWLFALDLV